MKVIVPSSVFLSFATKLNRLGGEQLTQNLVVEVLGDVSVILECLIDGLGLELLYHVNSFVDAVLEPELDPICHLLLTHALDAAQCLFLSGRVPPRIDADDSVRHGQIE